MFSTLCLLLVTTTIEVTEVSGVEPALREAVLTSVREEAATLGDEAVIRVRIIGGVTNTLLVLERSSESSAIAHRDVLLGTTAAEHRRAIQKALAELFPGRIETPEIALSQPAPGPAATGTPWASIGLLSAGLVAIGLSVWLSAEASATQAEIDRRVFVDARHGELNAERDVQRGAAVGLVVGGVVALLSGGLVLALD